MNFFRPGGARPQTKVLVDFIDQNRHKWGVGPICREIQIAPSSYYQNKVWEHHPETRSKKARKDDFFKVEIERVYKDNFKVYGARKIWKQLHREGFHIARCTVERLMQNIGIQGIVRGKKWKTTIADPESAYPEDLVNREFWAERPNQLWIADFTYVSTWSGITYVAFVIDVFARMIVGWRVSKSRKADLTLDALEQALWARQVKEGLIHHSDRGSQYLAFRYTSKLEDFGIAPSVGSTGDSYDNAMAETIIGLFKTEVIRRKTWKTMEEVELATLEWVDWFNHTRLLEPIGNIPPAELEEWYYTDVECSATAAGLT